MSIYLNIPIKVLNQLIGEVVRLVGKKGKNIAFSNYKQFENEPGAFWTKYLLKKIEDLLKLRILKIYFKNTLNYL